ncbi:Myosin head [Aphelenchoides besseyi]|nr:Myosin head [Aphelenchoides besseyi]
MDHENDPGWKYLRRTREQILEDQSKPFDHKKDCWIVDEAEGSVKWNRTLNFAFSYIAAQIKSTSGDQTTVMVAGAYGQNGYNPRDEPAKVREVRRHV